MPHERTKGTGKADAGSGRCLLCKSDNVGLARSHIFPRGFFKNWDGGPQSVTIKESGVKGRRLQNAIYDPRILCHDCEHTIMQPLDDYGIRIIRDKHTAKVIELVPGNPTRIWMFSDVDRRKMRAFFASVLWRVSVSRQKELVETSIGSSYENRIANDLLHDGVFPYIDAMVFYFSDPVHNAFFLPIREKLKVHDTNRDRQAVNGWLVQFPKTSVTLSLDKRPHPSRMYNTLSETFTGEALPARVSTSLSEEAANYRFMAFETDKQAGYAMQIAKVLKALNV